MITIQLINTGDMEEIDKMSQFCIDAFYNDDSEGMGLFSRKWKDIRLTALQKAQIMDLLLPHSGNRCVYIAKKSNKNEVHECSFVGVPITHAQRFFTHLRKISPKKLLGVAK